MSIPYEQIQKSFYRRIQTKEVIPTTLEEQWFYEAIGEMENECGINIVVDEITNSIENNLSRIQVSLIGQIMYSYYLYREYDKKLKLNNLIGRDISVKSEHSAKNMLIAYEVTRKEIMECFGKIIPSSYS